MRSLPGELLPPHPQQGEPIMVRAHSSPRRLFASLWRRWLGPRRPQDGKGRPRGVSLSVESLEDRRVPATFNIAAVDVQGLINAIKAANDNVQPDIINLAPNSTYTLTAAASGDHLGSGLPIVTADQGVLNMLTIQGNGS